MNYLKLSSALTVTVNIQLLAITFCFVFGIRCTVFTTTSYAILILTDCVAIDNNLQKSYLDIKNKREGRIFVSCRRFVGKTVDFILTEKRDKKAALSFFTKAIGQHGLPEKVTMDKSGAKKSAIDYVNSFLVLLSVMMRAPFQILVRQIKYLNNIIEQDHRAVKKITKPMLGFKAFHSAAATVTGIELHHMLKIRCSLTLASNRAYEITT